MRVWPGKPYPLGATWDGSGVNFALYTANGERADLCLFDSRGRETARIALPEYTDQVWHAYLPDARPGDQYGYRVYGPYAPERGHRFNHHKLLIDPYAKMLVGGVRWNPAVYGYRFGHPDGDLSFDGRDSAPFVPKCQVVDTAFTWGDDAPPRVEWHDSLVYEMNVRGFTKRLPGVEPEAAAGTFAGLASSAAVDYLRGLGVTAVELLPVHAFVDEPHLAEKGLVNFWGYNTIGFFAPMSRYMSSGTLGEFKTMVHVLHNAGIEVILDVVYNHTAESHERGPTLCFRGIDNASYYRLPPDDLRRTEDFTGCGNSFNLHNSRTLQLVMDSLRYWVEEMRVDGFRFDLATTLARNGRHEFDEHSGFLDAVRQDPVLAKVKLIAEPWDVGDGGYRMGGFPTQWAEWNDRYRDTVRRYWKGEPGVVPELASRITGSSDVFNRAGRRPWASINFVTAHDGYTLADLVSYEKKHNEANLENNRDGNDSNIASNHGIEGPTADPEIRRRRYRHKRNLMATLMLSQGVPMLLAGDELGRTQAGNNNAYCQDNELTWLDWTVGSDDDRRFAAFVRDLIHLRRRHIVFHRFRFFVGRTIPGTHVKDITWLRPDGAEMAYDNWTDGENCRLGALISGLAGEYHLTARGLPEPDETFVLLMNAAPEPVLWTLPPSEPAGRWRLVVDTAREEGVGAPETYPVGEAFPLGEESLALFVLDPDTAPPAR